jgi:hypothetical protein
MRSVACDDVMGLLSSCVVTHSTERTKENWDMRGRGTVSLKSLLSRSIPELNLCRDTEYEIQHASAIRSIDLALPVSLYTHKM